MRVFASSAAAPLVLLLAFSCQRGEPSARAAAPSSAAPSSAAPSSAAPSTGSTYTEGQDYLVMERVRFLDQMGFDRPVEAFSLLLPRGWTVEGGVRWLGVEQCRGDMVTTAMKASSPDGSIQLQALPQVTTTWAEGPMIPLLQAAAQGGGCEMQAPVDAAAALQQFAQSELGGARVVDLRENVELAGFLRQLNQQSQAISDQYGNGFVYRSSAVVGQLTWPDGSEGIALVAVMNAEKGGLDAFGVPNAFSTATVLQRTSIRVPAGRRAEAERLLSTVVASHRTNPVWQQAKDDFFTRLGNIEHAGNMERIRLQGEQSRAYAQAQSAASDARMRDWEQGQSSQDAQQRSFVQAIREVETWQTADGSTELSAGYDQAWSRGDGSYILSNSPDFDPARALKEDGWTQMQRTE